MTRLSERLDLGSHELISVVGAGGKTTTVKTLATELAGEGSRVVVTTTTKMGRNQVGPDALCSTKPAEVAAALLSHSPLFVACSLTDEKVTGPNPGQVDSLFHHQGIDHIVVEADGARKKLVKAPAGHEPRIPGLSTVVIVVASASAVGGRIVDVAHRPVMFAALSESDVADVVTPGHVASVLASSDGGQKGVPSGARRVALITNAEVGSNEVVRELRRTEAFHDVVAVRLDPRGLPEVIA